MYANLRVAVQLGGEVREINACEVLVDAGGIEVTEDLNDGGQYAERGQTEVFPLGTEIRIHADF